jgi:hypothetical protein
MERSSELKAPVTAIPLAPMRSFWRAVLPKLIKPFFGSNKRQPVSDQTPAREGSENEALPKECRLQANFIGETGVYTAGEATPHWGC